MIFTPEYCGVCSWRIDCEPAAYAMCAPSGDHEIAKRLSGSDATDRTAPSVSDRTTSCAEGRRDVAPFPAVHLTKATRDPSGDGTTPDSTSAVVQTARGSPPVKPACQRSPSWRKYTFAPSPLQKIPATWSDENAVNALGG